jgi:hypothetical protein
MYLFGPLVIVKENLQMYLFGPLVIFTTLTYTTCEFFVILDVAK